MPVTTYGAPIIDATPDCLPGLPADSKTLTWAEWVRRTPPRMEAPHLVLDRCPNAEELVKLRRELLRERREPRDGKYVCTVPYDSWSDVLNWLDDHRIAGADFARRYGATDPMEIGRFQNWTIVAREFGK